MSGWEDKTEKGLAQDIAEGYLKLQKENKDLLFRLQGLKQDRDEAWKKLEEWRTEIKQLEAQLNLDGTTNSQRCDRCHLANFFNGDEFKCWNCGLEHIED